MSERDPLDPRYFVRRDESPDPLFYEQPRFTVHIDDGAIAAATAVYRELLPEDGVILDLMSSWRSHLPTDLHFMEVVGLGLNAQEMDDNPQLDRIIVHDLNADPSLPFDDESFDGAVVTVSVQYMTRPVETFAEVNRVLRSGAPFVLTYSNRCFPTKAVTAWLSTTDQQHANIIATYFQESGNWGDVYAQDRSPRGESAGDPLFAVWAWKR
jgi:SAM-dependent methyltransferase